MTSRFVAGVMTVALGLSTAGTARAQTTALKQPASPRTSAITGTLAYRERMALPPFATLVITLEDVSRADAATRVISRADVVAPGNSPFQFELPFDAALIDARHRYAVRAEVFVDGQPLFVTTDVIPVLTQGHGAHVDARMRLVPRGRTATPTVTDRTSPFTPGEGLTRLPASFVGTLPCADCAGMRYALTLFADDSYILRMTPLGKDAAPSSEDLGSYVLSSDRRILVLKGSREAEYFAIRDNDTLRALDRDAQAIATKANVDLRRSSTVAPVDVTSTFRGVYRVSDGHAEFVECQTGQTWSVAEEPAATTLTQSLSRSRTARRDAVFAVVEGRITDRTAGASRAVTLDVARVVRTSAGESCAPRFAAAPFDGTEWRLVRVRDVAVPPAPVPARQPSLEFDDETLTVAGSTGCNRLSGRYERQGGALIMGTAGTMMACAGGDQIETLFRAALKDVRAFRIVGRMLELRGGDGQFVARLEAGGSK